VVAARDRRSEVVRAAVLAAALLVAACSHGPKETLKPAEGVLEELRAAVAREVKDPDRAKRAAALVDEMEQLTIRANADYKDHEARLRALNANYDATPEDFRALFRDFNDRRDKRQAQTLDLNRRAKALLTMQEWQELAKLREEAAQRAVDAGSEI
jgi:major membrane immunogen (membrane-anchored lipoprotein)